MIAKTSLEQKPTKSEYKLNKYNNFYKSKLKLFKNIKIEVKRAIEMGSNLLRDDKTMDSFSMLIQSHF